MPGVTAERRNRGATNRTANRAFGLKRTKQAPTAPSALTLTSSELRYPSCAEVKGPVGCFRVLPGLG